MKTLWWTIVYGALAGLIIGSGALFRAHAETLEWFPNVCVELRNGTPLAGVETLLLARGYTDRDAGALTGRMVRDHCPDQIESVMEQVP